jgi:hypothetical protein
MFCGAGDPPEQSVAGAKKNGQAEDDRRERGRSGQGRLLVCSNNYPFSISRLPQREDARITNADIPT